MIFENLTFRYGTADIFKNINLSIPINKCIGIVGVNGAGKTSLFKLLTKEIVPSVGKIIINKNTKLALLPQIIDDDLLDSDICTLDYLLTGRPIKELEAELTDIYNKVATEENTNNQNRLLKRIATIQNELEFYEVYNAESILLKITSGMYISDEILLQPLNTLSGGQKSKVAFARLLYSKPDIILLDEPTNHLDQSSKDYVIKFLKNYKGSVFIISHDVDFLNLVTTQTLFLDKRTKDMKLYNGNYQTFQKLRKEHDLAIELEAEKEMREINKLKAIVNLYSNSSGKRKRMAQDREKKLEKLIENKIEVIKEAKKVKLNITINRESEVRPLKIKNLNFKYNKDSNKNIISNLSFDLMRGEKFLIVGENGIGKSTIIKLIVNKLKADSGIIELGVKTDIAYYAQEHELLEQDLTILENFNNMGLSNKVIRSALGRFLFVGDDVYKRVKVLSPGERSRVALAKLSLSGANFLILDEPTNHLDPETQEIIAETFKDYPGTMLVVSHNPEFVDNLGVERLLILPEGQIKYYDKDTILYYENLNTRNRN